MFLVSFCNCLCPNHQSQVLSREWICSWSSADRRWVVSNYIAYYGVTYILDIWLFIARDIRFCCSPMTFCASYDMFRLPSHYSLLRYNSILSCCDQLDSFLCWSGFIANYFHWCSYFSAVYDFCTTTRLNIQPMLRTELSASWLACQSHCVLCVIRLSKNTYNIIMYENVKHHFDMAL